MSVAKCVAEIRSPQLMEADRSSRVWRSVIKEGPPELTHELNCPKVRLEKIRVFGAGYLIPPKRFDFAVIILGFRNLF